MISISSIIDIECGMPFNYWVNICLYMYLYSIFYIKNQILNFKNLDSWYKYLLISRFQIHDILMNDINNTMLYLKLWIGIFYIQDIYRISRGLLLDNNHIRAQTMGDFFYHIDHWIHISKIFCFVYVNPKLHS